ncbi:TadE/TadG family type IV pilus assembly protein [Clavibacter tessellarius]|uniref:TadE/TadG family type IV pilus assembly protein n=1 Tax=Clavibacter tessellarius TaxID=31965 RepID=UPI0039E95C94
MRDDRGSAPAEFVMVGALLVVLALSVVQLALALHVRTTVLDAAAEGARVAALAGSTRAQGVERTHDLIAAAVGERYAGDVTAATGTVLGHPVVSVTVRTTLPLFGLLGVDRGLEVTGHAAVERLG